MVWVSRARMKQTLGGDPLGAPEIVVEVLSPSNTPSEIRDKKHLCFAQCCEEFWIVDPKRRFIEVERNGSPLRVYRGTDRIPVGNMTSSLDEIFSDVESDDL